MLGSIIIKGWGNLGFWRCTQISEMNTCKGSPRKGDFLTKTLLKNNKKYLDKKLKK